MTLHIKDKATRRARLVRLFDADPDRPGIKDAFLRLWDSVGALHIEGPVGGGYLRHYHVVTPTGDVFDLTLWTAPSAVWKRDVINTQDQSHNVLQVPAERGDLFAIRNHISHRPIGA